MAKPTAEYVRSRLHYDPLTGIFIWRPKPEVTIDDRRWDAQYAGKIAGGGGRSGYAKITIDNVTYPAHRLAWLYMNGKWPDDEIDHENCDLRDNRWSNLRPASRPENGRNRRISRNNTSGFKGVCWDKHKSKWKALIRVNGKRKHLGNFAEVTEAAEAYAEAAHRLHGDFARIH